MEIGVNLPCLLEAAALFAVGCMPLSLPNILVTLFVSFFYGFPALPVPHLPGVAHNTTICTGNIRNVGQKAVSSFDREKRAIAENLPYLCKSDLFLCCRCGSRYPVFCAIWRKSSLAAQRCSGGFGLVDLEMRAKALRGITLHSAFCCTESKFGKFILKFCTIFCICGRLIALLNFL